MTKFKEYSPNQILLLPPSLQEWLPPDHLAYFISDLVNQLNLSEIYNDYDSSEGGQPAYHPLMMVKLLIYAYCVGTPSSRKIEKKTYEDVAFRIICAGHHPDHDTIAEFRRRHLRTLSGYFLQVLKICQKMGIVKLGHVALDSTKIKANASKHKAMSYKRMCQKEKELEKQIASLFKKADKVDEEEEEKYGKGKRGDELPKELRFRKKRLEKIREAKVALKAEAKKKGAKLNSRMQRNFTDPDSRIMPDSGIKSFIQGYNAQAAVDSHSQIIVEAAVTQDTVDKKQFIPLIKGVKRNTGSFPRKASGDSGYFSRKNIKYGNKKRIAIYLSPYKIKHTQEIPLIRGRPPKEMTVKERMWRKIRTKKGWAIYSKRKGIVEPVLGQIKAARGFRQFSFRGLEKVRAEWRLICMTHNVLKLYRRMDECNYKTIEILNLIRFFGF